MIKIVILSNHKQETEILEMVFRQNGYAYYTAKSTGFNYLQLLQYRPDVLLLEIPFQYMEQLSLLRLLRKNNRFAKTPIIGYGPASGPQAEQDMKAAGCTHYLPRPLKIQSLFQLMRKCAPTKDWDGEKKKLLEKEAESKDQDLVHLLESSYPANSKKEIMIKYVGKLLSFPFVVAKILEITDDPNRGADDLGRVVAGDPAICATILRVSNSALFASMGSKEIKTPKEAIVRLGFTEVKNISMGLGLMELFPERDTFGFQRTEFWIYALGRAIASDKIARQAGFPDGTMAFLAGLMADFSVLLLDSFFPDVFGEILGSVADDGCSFSEAFEKSLGYKHEEFLADLMESWRLPKMLCDAVRMQSVLLTSEALESPSQVRILADCVMLSSTMSRAGDIGQGCDSLLEMPPEFLIQELRLSTGLLKNMYDPILAGLSVFADFFSLDRKLLPGVVEEDQQKLVLYLAVGRRGFDPYQQFLSRYWRVKIVRDLEALEKALQESKYHCAFVTPATPEMCDSTKDFLKAFEGNKNLDDKALPVVAIWPKGTPSPIPGKYPFECVYQQTDTRQLLQTISTLVGE